LNQHPWSPTPQILTVEINKQGVEAKMAKVGSRRAAILTRLLPYISTDKYIEWNGYIVFGSSSASDVIEGLTDLSNGLTDDYLLGAMTHLVSDFKLQGGREQLAKRLSIGQTPKFKTDALDGLSQEDIRSLQTLLESLPEVQAVDQLSRVAPDGTDEDQIDAALAVELLGRLPRAVERAVHLDEMSLDRVPDAGLKRYFEEAHRCYLHGFDVACAVLCRAILESALESICNPKRTMKDALGGRGYFEALVNKATKDGLLTEDRPACAMQVRDAGNNAIHKFSAFEQRWRGKLDEILVNTRKVLIDLSRRKL
jgi:hypothetical protein